MPSPEDLDSLFQELKAVLTHPELSKTIGEVLSLPPDQRSQAAATQLTAQALAAKGVRISDRISISASNVDQSPGSTAHTAEVKTQGTKVPASVTEFDSQICYFIGPLKICVGAMPIVPPLLDDPAV